MDATNVRDQNWPRNTFRVICLSVQLHEASESKPKDGHAKREERKELHDCPEYSIMRGITSKKRMYDALESQAIGGCIVPTKVRESERPERPAI